MRIDGMSAIAVIVIVAFAIERIVTGVLSLLSFFRFWRRIFPEPATVPDTGERVHAEKKHKAIYFVFAGILGMLILSGYGGVRLFEALGFKVHPILDTVVTGLIWIAGADRVGALLNMPGAPGVAKPAPTRPIEITGTLILEEGASRKIPMHASEDRV